MKRPRKPLIFVADFETTVYDNQQETEVWAAACVEVNSEDVKIFHSIGEQLEYFVSLERNLIVYYHNLKFDGSFWLDYLLRNGFEQASNDFDEDNVDTFKWVDELKKNNTFKYNISAKMGQWYSMQIRVNNKLIELRDSLKLLPFSVEVLGSQFKTKHKKLNMEYKGYRYAGCEITEEEQEYIKNDVLVVKEAIEIMLQQGHNKLTIGSCCLCEFKKYYDKKEWEYYFPNLYNIELPAEHGVENAGKWVRKSYRGGWCYVVPEKAGKQVYNGVTLDVNSLYPSVMFSESGNRYPVGTPTFWYGNYIPVQALYENNYFFIHIRTRFYIRPNKLPFVQIKNSLLYRSTEMLKTSDLKDFKTGRYYPKHKNIFTQKEEKQRVDLYLTMTDYKLLQEHYYLHDCEIIDGCYFKTEIGIFDIYINRYKKIKQESTGAIRTLAKLFLNNLYGKMATSPESDFKVAYLDDEKNIKFFTVLANDKIPGFIPIGSAITSYARDFTIRTAQKNYHGPNKPGFIYADTDSIHCDLSIDEIEGITEHPTDFCCWKYESSWDIGIFVRQKTYIEHITSHGRKEIDVPYWDVKCAGMPPKCKELFINSLQGVIPKDKQYSEEELEFMKTKRELEDFKVGLEVPGKLIPKRIKGGIILQETLYTMRAIN